MLLELLCQNYILNWVSWGLRALNISGYENLMNIGKILSHYKAWKWLRFILTVEWKLKLGTILPEQVCPFSDIDCFSVIDCFLYCHSIEFHGIKAEVCIGAFLGHIKSQQNMLHHSTTSRRKIYYKYFSYHSQNDWKPFQMLLSFNALFWGVFEM